MIQMKLVTILAILFILSSCNGQQHKSELPPANPVEKTEAYTPNTQNSNYSLFSDVDNQISQVVRTLFQDSKGNLWFGTENGAFQYDGDTLIHINDIIGESGKGVTIKAITESKDGVIWLGHTDGISSITGDTVTNYYESDGLISNDVWSIAADQNGQLWIGTIKGVCVFNSREFTKFTLPEGEIDTTLGVSSKKMIHSIFEDSKGTLWFSTNAGLFSYANDSLTHVSEKAGIQTNFVNEIFEDSKGELWVSTKIGLYHLTNNKAINITEGKIETGKGIGSISEDKEGILWFVSNQRSLYTYDKGILSEYHKPETNKGPLAFQIYKDQQNRLWFVGFGGAYRLESGRFVNVTKDGPW